MRSSITTSTRGFSLLEMLIVSTMISTLIALLLPAVQAAREAARRSSCVNQIRQCMIGLTSYNLTHGTLPPGTVDPNRPIASVPKGYHHSWIVQILPYCDAEPLYDGFNFALDVYHPSHGTLLLTRINALVCPSDANRPVASQSASSSYAGCHHHTEAPIDVTNTGMLYLNSSIRPERIPDGLSQTFLLSEKLYETGDLGWGSGTRATLRNTGTPPNMLFGRFITTTLGRANPISPASPAYVGGFSSRHPGGLNSGFGDGSVRFTRDSISMQIYEALGHRMDDEVLNANSY